MWAVFANPSGYPDHLRFRDLPELVKRMDKLAEKGHPITILSMHLSSRECWQAMLKAQAEFKRERYGKSWSTFVQSSPAIEPLPRLDAS